MNSKKAKNYGAWLNRKQKSKAKNGNLENIAEEAQWPEDKNAKVY